MVPIVIDDSERIAKLAADPIFCKHSNTVKTLVNVLLFNIRGILSEVFTSLDFQVCSFLKVSWRNYFSYYVYRRINFLVEKESIFDQVICASLRI